MFLPSGAAFRIVLCCLCLGTIPSWVGGKSPSKPAPPRGAPAKPALVLSDEALQRAICSRFAASKIGRNGFTVTVRGGVATLTGTAQVPQHKGVATRLAKAAGAREVLNRIEIAPDSRPPSNPRTRQPAGKPGTAKAPPAATSSTARVPGVEPEAQLQTTASNRMSRAKQFRILTGDFSRANQGSTKGPRIRRY